MSSEEEAQRERLVRRHLALGWAGLATAVTLGMVLETFHAVKAPLYLDLHNATTRLLWRLAHAHLGVLSLTSLGFAFTVSRVPAAWTLPSRWLLFGSLLLPLGFFLGGFGAHGGDPGILIVLAAPGALCLLIACVRTFLLVWGGGPKAP